MLPLGRRQNNTLPPPSATPTPIPTTTAFESPTLSATTTGNPLSENVGASRPSSTAPNNMAPIISSKAQSQSKSTNGGVIAGAAVGALVAGIVVGLLVMLVLCNRRNRKRSRAGKRTGSSVPAAAAINEKSPAESSYSLPSDSAAAIVERNLKDPLSDAKLKSDYANIGQKIDQHVLSYYGAGQTSADSTTARSISNLLGSKSAVSKSTVTALLANARGRPALLRYAIARIIVSRLEFDAAPESSLLPAGVSHSVNAIPKAQYSDSVRTAFYVKWKVITAHLLGKTGETPDENIRKAVVDCNAIVGPFALQGRDAERLQHLEALISRSATIAEQLFNQPAFWKFDWQQPASGLVVFPGLVKVVDDTGKQLQPPVIFEAPTVVEL